MVPAGELGRPHEAKAVAEQGGAAVRNWSSGSSGRAPPPRSRRPAQRRSGRSGPAAGLGNSEHFINYIEFTGDTRIDCIYATIMYHAAMQIDALIEGFKDRFGVATRTSLAGVLFAGIFYVDLVTESDLVAGMLYVSVCGLLYSLRSPAVHIGFCLLCTLLNGMPATSSGISTIKKTSCSIGSSRSGALLGLLPAVRNTLSESVLKRRRPTDPLTGAPQRRHFMELIRANSAGPSATTRCSRS